MLIKEYRIPLPLTVEEYRVAQLYMIAKKSCNESKGAGSGVEILVNEPYDEGPGGTGQYTRKIYHVGNHLPGWLKALLPKSALTVSEEAWNAYPYTKTRYTCPFVEKFSLEIETKYFNDSGQQENVFDLQNSELRSRIVDVIDVVKDELYGSDYNKDEDPNYYISSKTKRGPLQENWINDYWRECENQITPLPNGKAIMCAYKLCKVEFRYWGMQSKIEKFIHDIALRKTMLFAHRQAWAWQDEWVGMTMEDIRKLERETQEALARKMAAENEERNAYIDTKDLSPQNDTRQSATHLPDQKVDLKVLDKGQENQQNMSDSELLMTHSVIRNLSTSPKQSKKPKDLYMAQDSADFVPSEDARQKLWTRSGSRTVLYSPSGNSNSSFDMQIANWRMESIVRDSESSSDEEFFDAEETILGALSLARWSSVELFPDEDKDKTESEREDDNVTTVTENLFTQNSKKKLPSEVQTPSITSGSCQGSIDTSLPPTPAVSPAHQSCRTTILALVFHAGSVLDSGLESSTSKSADITTFRTTFEAVMRQHYPAIAGHLAVRMVPCPSICSDSLSLLSNLSPYSFQTSPAADSLFRSYDSIPLGALALFCTSSPEYQDNLCSVITSCNNVYKEFLATEEGSGFCGQVVIIGDSVGSLMAYDALCQYPNYFNHYDSESVDDVEGPHSQETAGQGTVANPLISVSDNSSGSRKPYAQDSDSHTNVSENLMCRLIPGSNTRRHSTTSNEHSAPQRFEFEVTDLFMFGSPLGTVLAYRKMLNFEDKNVLPPRPYCNQVYNLFHPSNPCASRIEPLLCSQFSKISPISIPRYQKYPLGDGLPLYLLEYIQSYNHLFLESQLSSTSSSSCPYNLLCRRTSETSINSTMSGMLDIVPVSAVTTISQQWWGTKRLDYALYCPEGLSNFPTNALPHLFHASYWESFDVIAFILRQMMRSDAFGMDGDTEKDVSNFVPTQPREKWLKKRTSVKIKNVTANHRANDVIVKDSTSQVLNARFMYGPFALAGEKVDVHVMKDIRCGEWNFMDTEVTDKSGRLSYTISKDKMLGYGMFPIKMVVRGDHTSLDCFLAVVPPKTECVVFSIDGSFTASVSVTGRDPKVRAGAVDVVRHWQELGYLILYITGRPDMQQRRVMSWLSQHNFPLGLVYFADGLSTDPLKHKAEYLRQLQMNAEIVIHAGYGSSKDISVYSSVGLKADQTYVVGKASKKQHTAAKVLSEGYAAHLGDLKTPGVCRPAQGNARMVLFQGCFGFHGQGSGISVMRQHRSAKRTTSFPLTVQTYDARTASPTTKCSSAKL